MKIAKYAAVAIPALVMAAASGSAHSSAARIAPQAAAAAGAAQTSQAFLTQYCVTCHNQTSKTAGLTLDTMDVDHVEKNAETWERVVRKIRTGMMPPSGARRPERPALDGFAADLETRLDRASALSPNVGRPALHRLNRIEYGNAIRDLLAMDVDVAALLPSDDSVDGFDNIADALGVSPSLIQGYVSAAMKISRRAVGDRTLTPTQVTYAAPQGLKQDAHIEGLPLGTRGGMLVQHTFPLDAEYQISTGGARGGGGGADITIDGERPGPAPAGAAGGARGGAGGGAGGAAVPAGGAGGRGGGRGGAGGGGGAGPVGGAARGAAGPAAAGPAGARGAPGARGGAAGPAAGARGGAAGAAGTRGGPAGPAGPGAGAAPAGAAAGGQRGGGAPAGARGGGGAGGRVWVTAGPHTIAVATPQARRPGGVDSAYSDFRVDSQVAIGGGISSVTITGPYNSSGPGDTPSRRKIFVCTPQNTADETPCARKIVTALARRAFRSQAAADAALDGIMEFYQQGAKVDGFESGIQRAVARILVSPRFLFRMEDEPANVANGAAFRLNDVDLASRLSFFLWSSIPDDELLDLAVKGKLSDPAVLEAQTRRMLNDSRSDALVKNFAGQWLYLRDLSSAQPDTKDFDDNLRQAMRRETEMLFESIVREDRSIVTLLDADYTFVNARLAKHYGIPDIRGDYFRRIALDKSSPRRGILGHGSILTVTSTANRTSPVLRGKWILQNVLGTPPPVPPPGVEVNLDAPANAKPTTLRARLETHRSNPVCASCHKIMDPLGFSLENFDLIGKWRDLDNGLPIDATGTLVDGSPVAGAADLRKAVLARADSFVTTTAERLTTYALGRPVEHYDLPAVRAIVREAAGRNQTFSALVLGIVKSAPFQMKMKKAL